MLSRCVQAYFFAGLYRIEKMIILLFVLLWFEASKRS
jgi:hypothetical protein